MRFAVLTILLLPAFVCFVQGQTNYDAAAVKNFRELRDTGFRSRNQSPLLSDDFLKFKGLEYFDVSEGYAVKAKFEKTADAQVFMMPTSAGAARKYFKYGVLTFAINGQSFSLTVFESEAEAKKTENKGALFVPFRDLTNGKETYGAGRYLDVKIPGTGEAVIDFNFAYNPSCAYGDASFSCAIPPKENFLRTEIKAGEKRFVSVSAKEE
jgi:uncharacterized protein (DUF1684 family)